MGSTLHAIWHQSSLHLWAEEPAQAEPHTAGQMPGRHPFAMPADRLRALLGEMTEDALLATVARAAHLKLWLPAVDGSPQASADAPNPAAALAAFEVPTLALSAAQAVDLLMSFPRQAEGCAHSVCYWAVLSRFVLERMAQRQFFPDIDSPEGAEFVGTWRLMIHHQEDLDWLERFAAAMPPVCRAVAEVGANIDPQRLIESFLMVTTDALVRRDVSNDEFFQAIHGRAKDPAATIDLRWVSALLGEEPGVRGTRGEINAFAEQVRRWTARLDDARSAQTLRLSFMLNEPEDEEDDTLTPTGPWKVTFHLQSPDSDEFVDAEDLWPKAGDPPAILGRNLLNRRAQLQAELSAAMEWFPLVERALTTARPTHVELSPTEAQLFLRQWGILLRDHGYGVTLPGWAALRDRELGIQLVVRPHDELFAEGEGGAGRGGANFAMAAGPRFGLDSLLDFDWQLAVGDLQLSTNEFRSLVEQGTPLIRHRGQWLQIDTEAARRALEFIQKKQPGKMTLGEALKTAFAASRQDTGLPVVGLTGTSWIRQLLEQTPSAKMESLAQPPGFLGTLRPYQVRGLDWMAFLTRLGIGGCLADDMGLGKTIQLIALLLHERAEAAAAALFRGGVSPPSSAEPAPGGGETLPLQNAGLGPTLLFAPTSVVGNWVRELQRFAPSLKVLVHHGPERLHGHAFAEAAARNDVVITSYALAHRDVNDLTQPAWYRVALDEAQKIKNPSAASSLAIRSLAAPNRLALTGTPIENHLSELWSIMEMLNPGLLGTASEFRERFAVPIEKLSDQDRAHHLRRMIQPFVLRRIKSDPTIASDLPEKMEMKVFCNLTPEQASIYQRITAEMLGEIDAASGIRRRGLILAALTRLKQVCDHPVLLTKDGSGKEGLDSRSGKCERIIEMLEEVIEEGDAALVFTQYRQMGHILEEMIAKRLKTPVQFLHGGTPAKDRDAMIERFNAPKSDIRIFLLSLRAGGLGLNLTAANHVFHFDRWWNPAVESQATDRAHRIGQTRKVQVHKFVCVGTMEERIDRMLTEKLALAERIVGTGDEWLTEMSTDQLRDYLALSDEAVGEF